MIVSLWEIATFLLCIFLCFHLMLPLRGSPIFVWDSKTPGATVRCWLLDDIGIVLVLTVYISCLLNAAASANSPCCPVSQLHFVFVCHCMHTPRNKQMMMMMMMMMMSSSVSTHCISVSDGRTNSATQHRPNYTAIVVKFEEINLKFRKVRKSFFKKFKIHIQSQQYCYRTTISIVCVVTMLKCVQYNALQQGSWLTYITVSTVVLNCCKGDRPSQWEYPIFGPL